MLIDHSTGGIKGLVGYRGEGVYRGFNSYGSLQKSPFKLAGFEGQLSEIPLTEQYISKGVKTMAEFKETSNSLALSEILNESCQRKVIIFKHSTMCPISARAWQEVQDFISQSPNEVLVTMIKVIESRPVSNQVAEELGVKHQSPQVLLVCDRKALWNASHQAVTKSNITKALEGETQLYNINL